MKKSIIIIAVVALLAASNNNVDQKMTKTDIFPKGSYFQKHGLQETPFYHRWLMISWDLIKINRAYQWMQRIHTHRFVVCQ